MYKNCHLPTNMTEGSKVKIFGDKKSDPLQAFMECFNHPSLKGLEDEVLILIDPYEEDDEKKLRDNLKCKCKDDEGILSRIAYALLLQELGREVPLFHTRHSSSGREKIKLHMIKPKRKQDLVCEQHLAKGYEYEKVIICNLNVEHLSRASIDGIEVRFDPNALVKFGLNSIRNNTQHKCGELPKLTSDDDLLHSRGLSRSKTLQEEQDYLNNDSNPILSCLEDQSKYDPELKDSNLTQSRLLELMIKGLENKTIHLRLQKLGLENSPDWLKWLSEMTSRRNHYQKEPKSGSFEILLLDLACQLLKRKITLIINGLIREELVFKPETTTISQIMNIDFYILKCNLNIPTFSSLTKKFSPLSFGKPSQDLINQVLLEKVCFLMNENEQLKVGLQSAENEVEQLKSSLRSYRQEVEQLKVTFSLQSAKQEFERLSKGPTSFFKKL